MIKNKSEHSSVYTDELINTIEQDFIFSNKPINRFKNNTEIDINKNPQKNELLEELKNQINSIENCNLKSNSKNIVLGDGNPNSPIMLIGEAPTTIEDENCKVFLGEVGVLLDKMLNAINIKRNSIYLCYAINFRPPQDPLIFLRIFFGKLLVISMILNIFPDCNLACKVYRPSTNK